MEAKTVCDTFSVGIAGSVPLAVEETKKSHRRRAQVRPFIDQCLVTVVARTADSFAHGRDAASEPCVVAMPPRPSSCTVDVLAGSTLSERALSSGRKLCGPGEVQSLLSGEG